MESCSRFEHDSTLSVSLSICCSRSLDSSTATPAMWLLKIGFVRLWPEFCLTPDVLHWSFSMSMTSTICLTLGVIFEIAIVGPIISLPNSSYLCC